MAVLIGICVIAAALVTAIAVVRYFRDDETLRWERIAQRARVREAATRAAAKYEALPAMTVAAPLVPVTAPDDRAA